MFDTFTLFGIISYIATMAYSSKHVLIEIALQN